ncbi:MAG TPA: hypothetical protein VJA25_02560 [Dehalococcoidia bacterium]|nr:hypothetical protein [Dehalococcoidia bacterium]
MSLIALSTPQDFVLFSRGVEVGCAMLLHLSVQAFRQQYRLDADLQAGKLVLHLWRQGEPPARFATFQED